MASIELKAVRKSFQAVEVLHRIDLKIEDGDFTVFVGPSGCGKSTLLRLMAGLEQITGGEILIDGERCDHLMPATRGMAMVFQSYAPYPHMSVEQNLRFGLENQKLSKVEIAARVQKAADILQIQHLLTRRPHQLSGGQSQRVAIGRAIVKEPKAFLFDEPLSNLDAELRLKMRDELAALHHRLGATMVYVTHDQVEAMTMADTIVVLRDGNVEQVGSPTSSALLPQIVTTGIRPEHLFVTENGSLTAVVNQCEVLGAETIIHATISNDKIISVSIRGILSSMRGAAIRIGIDASNLHFFDAGGKRISVSIDFLSSDSPYDQQRKAYRCQ